MDLYKIIAELHERLKQVDEAILHLEALQKKGPNPSKIPRKRGRPPKNTQKSEPKVK